MDSLPENKTNWKPCNTVKNTYSLYS
ncbi:hypothetical protein NC651_025945 [Populus alba x Populus x berolinensis]|nr:hypothetical protein NC651_025945 [Populus alba x Populus x berolinensis]